MLISPAKIIFNFSIMKYFLYLRKSTDEDDKQVLSLEAQEAELKEFALRDGLNIVSVLTESQTAKCPGRPVFNAMLTRIEAGEADGIIAWHPDRLARNSVDGGRIIFLIDTLVIKALKFPTFWFEATPQGKFMLNIAFGQSKYFVDNLSENVKRGLRQKLRRGEMPGLAPLGYLNDLRTHTLIPDPKRFKQVKKIFIDYSTGKYSLRDLRESAISAGLLSRSGNTLSCSTIQLALSNPCYYGAFKYNGELHEGKHKPMISRKIFEECQKVMKDKSRPKKRKLGHLHAFRGLLKCGECGCAITSEVQKGHVYYRCTKKKNACSQKYIREENLTSVISGILQKFSLSAPWADEMIKILEIEKTKEAQGAEGWRKNIDIEVSTVNEKLNKLLDAHLDGTLDKEEYVAKKEELINLKTSLNEKSKSFSAKPYHWLEQAEKFILDAKQAGIIALSENLPAKGGFLGKIGSNLALKEGEVIIEPKEVWKILYFKTNFAPFRPAGGKERPLTPKACTEMLPRSDSNRRPTR